MKPLYGRAAFTYIYTLVHTKPSEKLINKTQTGALSGHFGHFRDLSAEDEHERHRCRAPGRRAPHRALDQHDKEY